MTAAEFLPGIGKAASCQLAIIHQPKPLRFVWHHVLPETCGGLTQTGNLASVCDNDHYAVHVLMWYLANGGIPLGVKGTRKQLALARLGYEQAVAAGTAGRIPKEA